MILGRDISGDSVQRTAWTFGLGFAIGMFPLMGVPTLACVALAALLHFRQTPMQAGNWVALPLQIGLLIPFLRLGEKISGAERFVFDPPALLRGFPNIPESTARAVVMAQWHMILGWAVVAPVAAIVGAAIAWAVLRRLSAPQAVRIPSRRAA